MINQPKQSPDVFYQNIYIAGAGLYDLLWAPLESCLKDVKTIYISPSGLLHQLNMNAIQTPDYSLLSQRYRLVQMGSTRNLVVPAGYIPSANTAVLFGGIRYDMDSTKISAANAGLSADGIATRGSGGFVYTDSTLRGGSWAYLPATAQEIDTIGRLLESQGYQPASFREYAATEENLKAIGRGKTSPRILHIATHGFFFPDPAENPTSQTRYLLSDQPVFRISDNPMIRSGLILAGAEHAWKTGKPLRPDMEDGVLTAYEISQMNLRNTELVVLSACETGLGDIQGNEGVYGLQRAFKIAGAKYLIMSLWQVPDRETSEFMTAFYRHWLAGKQSIPDAFRSTQEEMRAKHPNPYYWDGFVLVE